ncbi:MAG: ATP synthase subunit I [Chromatiaceae bacterium]|nr:MAG: ATP synthase subunit I [Chromatiaceae bacterium]
MQIDAAGPYDTGQIKKLLVLQAIFAILAIAMSIPFGTAAVVSAGLGAIICVVANWLFAFWVFQRYRADQPERLLSQMYAGEMVKLVVILGAFVAAYVFLPGLNIIGLIGAFFVVQVVPPVFATRPAPRASNGLGAGNKSEN